MPIMITELRGCTDLMAARLAETGIVDAGQLLACCATPVERQSLSHETGIDDGDLLALANRADLSRIRGVAGVYGDLLERAGVDTVRELATRRADRLFEKLVAANAEGGVTNTPPTPRQVEKWIDQARRLKPALEY
jgi:hypothetical protein